MGAKLPNLQDGGGGTTILVLYHYPLVTQKYPQARLNKLFEGILLVIATSDLVSSPYFTRLSLNIFLPHNKTNITKAYLASLIKP